jgi:hypothetical protein
MLEWLHGQKQVQHCLTCTDPGRVDAVAMWFDLHLDDVTTLSSAPHDDSDRDGVHRASCWDQAIFPVQSPIHVISGQKLNLSVSCHGGKVSVDICDEHRNGDTHAISKLQDAFSFSRISAVQDDSQTSREFPKDDWKSTENFSSTAVCDAEYSKNFPLNILTNWKKETSLLHRTAHRKVLQNTSTNESLLDENEEEKVILKEKQKDEMTLREAEFNSNVLRSGSCSKKMLHEEPVSDIGGDTTRKLGCSGLASQEVVQFLNDEQWMEALKKTAILLCHQVKACLLCK